MFRSLMTIITELYLSLTKVLFMSKHSVKLRRYIYWVMWQHVVEWHVCCVQCDSAHNTHGFYNRDEVFTARYELGLQTKQSALRL